MRVDGRECRIAFKVYALKPNLHSARQINKRSGLEGKVSPCGIIRKCKRSTKPLKITGTPDKRIKVANLDRVTANSIVKQRHYPAAIG